MDMGEVVGVFRYTFGVLGADIDRSGGVLGVVGRSYDMLQMYAHYNSMFTLTPSPGTQ